ncbi:OsmC family protein [Aureivirga sp. CE67]|uniref:OsmC family protein n=1 Tax=Aureivirga sp. CE67 TaxID=1788983 RepID=UPI0018C95D11|nr:OsmC family protein [Aureivirga sp. CE67]
MMDKVVVSWQENMHLIAEQPGGTVSIDAGEEFGGENKGLRPKAMMLSGLGGCAGLDVAAFLKKMRVTVDTFKIEMEASLTEEHPRTYDKVKMVFKFFGKDFEKDKIQKVVDLSVDKYCGVLEMFRQFAELEISVEYIEQ